MPEGPSNEYSEGPVGLEEDAPNNEYSDEGALYFDVGGPVEVGLLEGAPSNEYSDERG